MSKEKLTHEETMLLNKPGSIFSDPEPNTGVVGQPTGKSLEIETRLVDMKIVMPTERENETGSGEPIL